MDQPEGRKRGGLRGKLKNLGQGAQNAVELLRRGRLGAPWRAPHEEVMRTPTFALRRYHGPSGAPGGGAPVVLVPPLMVSSEIYDISPELSAVGFLVGQGLDVWLVDFGAPEDSEGGLERTLDDHILAVARAIEEVAAQTGRAAHLLGYSQGGMFVYQAVAWLGGGAKVASLVTFGSPVDIWRNVPGLHEELTGRMLEVAGQALARPLEQLPGLPGALTSQGFKLLNARKEARQWLELVGLLHDRDALKAREPKRRFLGGEGFVSWPGPALRDLIDQVVVGNRMASGGMVIQGRAVALADITAPILCFVGRKDDLVLPAAVRAIRDAAPRAEIHERLVPTGHFGLVVGSQAMTRVWPAVAAWVAWREGQGPPLEPDADEQAEPEERGLYELASEVLDGLWRGLGRTSVDFAHALDAVRWQLPRLARIESLDQDEPASLSRMLAEQARAIPRAPFFLWEGRAFTYAEADARVNRLLWALRRRGVAPGAQVGVWMDTHPDALTALMALGRLGAVAVVLPADARAAAALEAASPPWLLVDRRHAQAPGAEGARRLCLGRGGALPEGVFDLEADLRADQSAPPDDIEADPGRPDELALLLFTGSGRRAARVTHRRQVAAALGAAAACQLSPGDTVYVCLPLDRAPGLLVAAGGALAGGARLALAPGFDPHRFWAEVRRVGATVTFLSGERCGALVAAPPRPDDDRHPLRLLATQGLDADTWERAQRRFGPLRIVEFYGSTEGNVALVNLNGQKPGAVGRPLIGGGGVELLRYDRDAQAIARDPQGRAMLCDPLEPGLLVARVDPLHPLSAFEGYADPAQTEAQLLRDLFAPGDAWFVSGDLLFRDEEGDLWFAGRAAQGEEGAAKGA